VAWRYQAPSGAAVGAHDQLLPHPDDPDRHPGAQGSVLACGRDLQFLGSEASGTPGSGTVNGIGEFMDIELVVGGSTLGGTLDDTAAGRDLASVLPLTLPSSTSTRPKRSATCRGGWPSRTVTSRTTHHGATWRCSTATPATPTGWSGWVDSTPQPSTSSRAWTTPPPSPSPRSTWGIPMIHVRTDLPEPGHALVCAARPFT
jgi:hypothetical protein